MDESDVDRLWERIKVHPLGCWEWQGVIRDDGYGVVRVKGAQRGAHRVAYEVAVGPIPAGLTIDHLCFNRRCINPAHLDPCTALENVQRARNAGRFEAKYRSLREKEFCLRGHPRTEENTYTQPAGWKRCRVCQAAQQRARKLKAAA